MRKKNLVSLTPAASALVVLSLAMPLWGDGFMWSDTATVPASVNVWVEQE